MPADLKKPFSESCCDGGACGGDKLNADPCGCDRRIEYKCGYHTAYEIGYNDGYRVAKEELSGQTK